MPALVIARTGLRPVERLTLAAENVAATERLDPIEVQGSDELARLTSAFNSMLAALAASRDRQRALVADAGHELRTPLTSLRTNLDLLAQSESGEGLGRVERAELVADVRAQVTELSDLVGDLVELSRTDELLSNTAMVETIDLADVVRRAVERVTRRAPAVRFVTDARAVADARRPAEPGTSRDQPARQRRQVEPGRGHRHDIARRRRAVGRRRGPGHRRRGPAARLRPVLPVGRGPHAARVGLGLAIVRHAVERHGGTVTAARAPEGGTLMVVALPLLRRLRAAPISFAPSWLTLRVLSDRPGSMNS